jgi:hypothetical protein
MVWVTGAALIAALLGLIWLLEKRGCELDRGPLRRPTAKPRPWKPQVFGPRRLSCFSSTTSSTLNVYQWSRASPIATTTDSHKGGGLLGGSGVSSAFTGPVAFQCRRLSLTPFPGAVDDSPSNE